MEFQNPLTDIPQIEVTCNAVIALLEKIHADMRKETGHVLRQSFDLGWRMALVKAQLMRREIYDFPVDDEDYKEQFERIKRAYHLLCQSLPLDLDDES